MALIIAPGSRAISTLYGWPGSKEVRALLKQLRLGKEHLKDEGHPTDEHIVLPVAKLTSPRIQALSVVTGHQFAAIQAEKQAFKASSSTKGTLTAFASTVVESFSTPPTNGKVSDARLRDQDRNKLRRHKARGHEEAMTGE